MLSAHLYYNILKIPLSIGQMRNFCKIFAKLPRSLVLKLEQRKADIIMTTGKAGGLLCGCKPLLLAGLKAH